MNSAFLAAFSLGALLAVTACSRDEPAAGGEAPPAASAAPPAPASSQPAPAETAAAAAAPAPSAFASGSGSGASASASAAPALATPVAILPMGKASAAASARAAPACGDKPLPPCPLYAWMKANTSTAMSASDFDALATALDKVVTFAPPGYVNWASISKDGAGAARAQNLDAVKASCRGCHNQYKDRYKKELRDRPI